MTRVVAVTTPLSALAVTSAALALGGGWPQVAALVAAALCVFLGGVVLRSERRRRLDIARTRAEQADAYNDLHAQHSHEHLEFTGHMAGLIDAAEGAMGRLRTRLDGAEVQLGQMKEAVVRSGQAARRADLARAGAERRAVQAERATAEATAMLEESVALSGPSVAVELGVDDECVVPEPAPLVRDTAPLVEPGMTGGEEAENAPEELRRTA